MTEQLAEQSTVPSGARWYIIHTYSGQEDKVKRNLEQRIESMDAKDQIFQVSVPTVEEIEIKDGRRKSIQRKIFPGYILVQMMMNDDMWRLVRETPSVTGFVSAEDERERRPKPVPLDDKEAEQILNRIESTQPRIRVELTTGQPIRVNSGPFADFIGVVDQIDEEKGKVRISVSFFGRETPVELDFMQVEKI
jgi:transcriptional antiterminator NusG